MTKAFVQWLDERAEEVKEPEEHPNGLFDPLVWLSCLQAAAEHLATRPHIASLLAEYADELYAEYVKRMKKAGV